MPKEQKTTSVLSIFVFESILISEEISRVIVIVKWITEQAIKHIVAFSEALKRVHIRLISEGYLINNGVITPPVDTPTTSKSNVIKTQQNYDNQSTK